MSDCPPHVRLELQPQEWGEYVSISVICVLCRRPIETITYTPEAWRDRLARGAAAGETAPVLPFWSDPDA